VVIKNREESHSNDQEIEDVDIGPIAENDAGGSPLKLNEYEKRTKFRLPFIPPGIMVITTGLHVKYGRPELSFLCLQPLVVPPISWSY
jgi:hypothetical protein